MSIAVFTKPGAPLDVVDATPRGPGPREVVVEIEATGICHTDVSVANGDIPIPADAGSVVLGHEAAGRVVEVGSQVTTVAVGDRVVVTPVTACGRCAGCLRGEPYLCATFLAPRTWPVAHRLDGGRTARGWRGLGTFGHVVLLHEQSVVSVQSDLPSSHLAMLGCAVVTGLGAAVYTAGVRPGDRVVIIGAGGVGLSAVQGARLCGARQIIVIEPREHRRHVAAQTGATDTVEPSDDSVARIVDLTSGGADHVIETSGVAPNLVGGWQMLRPGGVETMLGMPPVGTDVTFSGPLLLRGGKSFRASMLGSVDMRRDLSWIVALAEDGRVDLEPLLTQVISLNDINDGIEQLRQGQGVRTMVDMSL